jgi:hypothetical protein
VEGEGGGRLGNARRRERRGGVGAAVAREGERHWYAGGLRWEFGGGVGPEERMAGFWVDGSAPV